jgi:hypothetical protein
LLLPCHLLLLLLLLPLRLPLLLLLFLKACLFGCHGCLQALDVLLQGRPAAPQGGREGRDKEGDQVQQQA